MIEHYSLSAIPATKLARAASKNSLTSTTLCLTEIAKNVRLFSSFRKTFQPPNPSWKLDAATKISLQEPYMPTTNLPVQEVPTYVELAEFWSTMTSAAVSAEI